MVPEKWLMQIMDMLVLGKLHYTKAKKWLKNISSEEAVEALIGLIKKAWRLGAYNV